jgi:hypothetical protein
MYRSTVSAKYRSAKNNDRVVSITWTPALTDEEAFIQEYILMKKRGVRDKNTYNRKKYNLHYFFYFLKRPSAGVHITTGCTVAGLTRCRLRLFIKLTSLYKS